MQGVGFRPFVYRLARECGLVGWVRNEPSGVTIEGWAGAGELDTFHARLVSELPALARIDRLRIEVIDLGECVWKEFVIVASEHEATAPGRVTIDCATCDDCAREMHDPEDRRSGHGLINCTNCGPRYSIVRGMPYDRASTTMAGFPMCEACAREYRDPMDRRFHAQPICCHECGPRLELRSADGKVLSCDVFNEAAKLLRAGKILAIKGIGGYHLAVDACNETAVARLRQQKRRDHKPFALMVGDVKAARVLVELSQDAEHELTSPAAPIILARARADTAIAPGVAAGCHRLGVMLASTPMQLLLFAQGLGPLVMTSANASNQPLITDENALYAELSGVFDASLMHDRPIERAVDDSVLLDGSAGLVPFRRARGYVPVPLRLPIAAPSPGLCAGAELKNTIALVRGNEAIVSQHIGNLSHTLAYTRFMRTADDLQRLFHVEPEWIACDAHPGYLSRRYARELAAARRVPCYEVQHHHAHLASLLAEHGRTDRIIGLVCDGVGYGDDGTAWGGEVLVGDLVGYERVGRMRPMMLPGGDVAAKQTGRCAAAWLWDLYGEHAASHALAHRVIPDDRTRETVFDLLRRGTHCPISSGMGRLFDAAASLLGVCDCNHYEAMSGQLLEAAASRATGGEPWEGLVCLRETGELLELDNRPLLERLVAGVATGEAIADLAWGFHDAVAAGLASAVCEIASRTGIAIVGLTGGVFCNDLLLKRTRERLDAAGLVVLTHKTVPPNDGGLSLGQAAVVGAILDMEVK